MNQSKGFIELTDQQLFSMFDGSPVIRKLTHKLAANGLYSSENIKDDGMKLVVDINRLLGGNSSKHKVEEFIGDIHHVFSNVDRENKLKMYGIRHCVKTNAVITPGCIIYLADLPNVGELLEPTFPTTKPNIAKEVDMDPITTAADLRKKAKFIRELMIRKTYIHKTMYGTRESFNPRPSHSPYEQAITQNVLVRLDDTVLSRVLAEFSKQSNFEHALFEENIVLKEETYTQVDEDDKDVVVVRMAACLIADNGVVHCTFTPHATDLYNLDNLN